MIGGRSGDKVRDAGAVIHSAIGRFSAETAGRLRERKVFALRRGQSISGVSIKGVAVFHSQAE